jgi:hypothetical protein
MFCVAGWNLNLDLTLAVREAEVLSRVLELEVRKALDQLDLLTDFNA